MKLFLDISPAFYKTLLFNELSKKIKILVVYFEDPHRPYRDDDFLKGEKEFEHITIKGNLWEKCFKIASLIHRTEYEELIVGGYESISCWLPVFLSPRKKNSIIVESTLRETTKTGIRAWLKRLFFTRVSKTYVCGKSHKDLVQTFGFFGQIIDMHSVGFIRKVPQPKYEERREVRNFIYVGRLTRVKNLEWLIERFNNHPELNLTIIGAGELNDKLRALSSSNIHFIGAVQNSKLPHYYKEADVFILPSLSEPYGLVVEEALNNGTPVLLSHMIGCQDNLVAANNVGLIFKLNDIDDFEEKLREICDLEIYNKLRYNISMLDFEKFDEGILNAFVN